MDMALMRLDMGASKVGGTMEFFVDNFYRNVRALVM